MTSTTAGVVTLAPSSPKPATAAPSKPSSTQTPRLTAEQRLNRRRALNRERMRRIRATDPVYLERERELHKWRMRRYRLNPAFLQAQRDYMTIYNAKRRAEKAAKLAKSGGGR